MQDVCTRAEIKFNQSQIESGFLHTSVVRLYFVHWGFVTISIWFPGEIASPPSSAYVSVFGDSSLYLFLDLCGSGDLKKGAHPKIDHSWNPSLTQDFRLLLFYPSLFPITRDLGVEVKADQKPDVI